MDVIETRGCFQDLIILQTVLEEVRNRSPSVHQRVRALLSQSDKRAYLFSNEHHRETYAGEPGKESANDRNDRAIRMASAWYAKHLGNQELFSHVHVVMLSNDAGNRAKATAAMEEDNAQHPYTAISLGEYCKGLPEHWGLLQEMLATGDDFEEEHNQNQQVVYEEEHWSQAVMQASLDSGKALKGVLHVSSYNAFEGLVSTGLSGELASIQIHGRQHMNRALNGDTVAVQLLPKEEWSKPEQAAEEAAEDGAQVQGALIVADEADNPHLDLGKARGRIVGIANRKFKAYCGSIDRKGVREGAAGLQSVLFCPMDRRIPRIRLRTRQATALAGQRILVAVDGWDRRSALPHGHLVRQLGAAGDRATETEAILLEYDVAHDAWTPAVLACLPAAGADWTWTEADMLNREDLRALDVCSIDPPGCTDIDDALHAFPLPNGNFQVGVHIADVTHFVKPGTALDAEATARGTTVYLVDRRIDMLPGLLGTNLCSLKGNVDRFAFSVLWEMDADANVLSTRFTKSLIRSKASFTYDQAQERLEGKGPQDDALTRSIRILNGLAQRLKAMRIAAGALTLASPEVRFSLDQETQNPVDVQLKEMKEANSLVEEFMLLANISVAQQLYAHFPDTSVLRRHPAPPAENFEALNRALAARNPDWALDVSSSKALAASLDHASDPQDPYLNRLVRIMTTRCMLQAQYFASGTLPYSSFWHYGLAAPIYTHFTSPIRRYADVLVHRLLQASLQDPSARHGAINWDKQRGEDICLNLNYRHRMAQQAQRSSVELFTHLYFRDKGEIRTDAYVIKMMKTGLVVLIPQYGIEGLIPMKDQQSVVYDAAANAFVSTADPTKPVIGLFQHVRIALRVETSEASQRQTLSIRLIHTDAADGADADMLDQQQKRSKSSP